MNTSIWELIAAAFGAVGSLCLFNGIENRNAKIGAFCVYVGLLIAAILFVLSFPDHAGRWITLAITIIIAVVGAIIVYINSKNQNNIPSTNRGETISNVQSYTNCNPKITIEVKIDTADYIKMDIYQRKDFDDFLEQIRRINAERKLNSTLSSQSQETIIKKLNSVEKETVLGSNLGIYGLSFAFITYAVATIYKNVLQGIAGLILAVVMFWLGSPNNRKKFRENKTILRLTFGFIIGIVLALVYLSVRYIIAIPI